MSFPGQRLQLRLVERRETAEKPLSFLQILNRADQPLDKHWRLYFSLGLTPKEGETRVLKIIVDGRYGYLDVFYNELEKERYALFFLTLFT